MLPSFVQEARSWIPTHDALEWLQLPKPQTVRLESPARGSELVEDNVLLLY